MNNVRDILTLAVMAGLGLAVLLNAGNATEIVRTVSESLLGLVRTVSGTDPQQR